MNEYSALVYTFTLHMSKTRAQWGTAHCVLPSFTYQHLLKYLD